MNNVNIIYRPLSEENAIEMCTWKYEEPYAIYSWGSWEELATADEEPIVNPSKREENFLGAFDNGKLIGFVEFSYPKENITRLGLGLHPDYCGKGIGNAFVKLIIKEAKKRAPDNLIDLEVLTWNQRAYKTYKRSGFEKVETYNRKTPTGVAEFHRMIYKG